MQLNDNFKGLLLLISLFISIFAVITLLVCVFVFSFGEVENNEYIATCVPAECCHATECVPEEQAPDCFEVFCSMSCEPGTLDCGQAECKYIDSKCQKVDTGAIL